MKHIFWGRLFIPLIFGCLLFSPSWSAAAEISGTVFLPAGDTAPTKGLSVEVRVEDQNGGNEASTYADIPEGASKGTYSITISDDPAASWIVHYYYFDNNYLKNGYYTNSGTSWDERAATPLGNASHSEINLTLLRGNVINGTVYLPAAASQDQDTQVRIEITNLNRDAVDYEQILYIDAFQSTATYAIRVVNDPNASWEVKYTYYSNSSYVPDGYYQSPSITTWNRAAATLLQGNQDYSGIDLTLLVGRTISGTAVLPDSATAPQDGISFDVYAVNTRNTEYSYSQWVTIDQNTNSISYTIRVPDDENATWQIHYETDQDDYLDKGYYAGAETTWDITRATLLPGGQEHSDIDISLLTGSLIRGSLSRPPNTSGTGFVDIIISNGKGYTYTDPSYLDDSTSSSPYNLRVANDPDSQWTVSYHYYGSDYVNFGYYTPAGTKWNRAEASTLAGNQDHADIDLTLLEGNKLSGTISLPQNRTAGDAVEIHLHARDANGSDRYGESSAYITQGESSASYTISVPDDPDASWKIDYLCYSDHIFRRGYYADSGTTWNPAAATLLPGNTDHTAKDITMLPGYEIFGRISLPKGATPPEGELNIGINAFDTHNNIQLPAEIFAIGGDKGDDPLWTYYAITVLDDDTATWRISYSYTGNEYLPAGYYAASGTTGSRDSATLLSGNQDYNDINLTLLHHKKFSWLLFLPAMISHSDK